jgi:hypothetical protein
VLDQPPVRDVSFAEVQRHNARRTLPDSAYRARIAFVDRPRRLPASSLQNCEVLVTNAGTGRWPGGERTDPQIQLGVRWHEHRSGRIVRDIRQPFTELVEPGQTTRVVISAPTPFDPGRHSLEIGVVQLGVRWFEGRVAADVLIEPRRDDAVTWGVRGHDRARARELGARVAELEQENAALRSQLASARPPRAPIQAR